MDPAKLLCSESVIRDEVASILKAYGNGEGHVFNLGHGITPEVDPEMAGVFINAVHELSAQYHDENLG
jgi:uroporphyrinogen decarboxylase